MTKQVNLVSSTTDERSDIRRVVAASFMGTAMETYDLYLYGTAAALVFSATFFPNYAPGISTILSLSTFAVSFIARPLGAVVFGHYGDRIGRKKMLYITLLLMGLGTFAIGLLPTYASIGIAAPACLVALRFLQGFGFGGEYSGAVLMIAEHAPPEKRGFYSGLNNIGPAIGFVISTGIFLAVTSLMSGADFLSWGWRIPFLFSVLLVAIGLYLRTQVAETPIFKKAIEENSASTRTTPITGVLKHYPKELALATGALMLIFAMFYLFSVHSLSYGTKELGMSRTTLLTAAIIAMVVNAIAIPIFSAMSDRVGRRATCLWGTALTAAWAFPFYWLFDTRNAVLVTFAFCVQMILYGMVYGPVAAYLSELFGPSVRYTGMAVSYNLAGILGAAPAPILATVLLHSYGGSWAISAYLIVLAAISFACLFALPETKASDLMVDRTTS